MGAPNQNYGSNTPLGQALIPLIPALAQEQSRIPREQKAFDSHINNWKTEFSWGGKTAQDAQNMYDGLMSQGVVKLPDPDNPGQLMDVHMDQIKLSSPNGKGFADSLATDPVTSETYLKSLLPKAPQSTATPEGTKPGVGNTGTVLNDGIPEVAKPNLGTTSNPNPQGTGAIVPGEVIAEDKPKAARPGDELPPVATNTPSPFAPGVLQGSTPQNQTPGTIFHDPGVTPIGNQTPIDPGISALPKAGESGTGAASQIADAIAQAQAQAAQSAPPQQEFTPAPTTQSQVVPQASNQTDPLQAQKMLSVDDIQKLVADGISKSQAEQLKAQQEKDAQTAAERAANIEDNTATGLFGGKNSEQHLTFEDTGKLRTNLDEDRDLLSGKSAEYQLTPADYAAYGQGADNIARMFGQSEQSLAGSLADRGLGAAPNGIAPQMFSGLQGNKHEQLANLQTQIADKRIATAQDMAKFKTQADVQRMAQAQNTSLGLGNLSLGLGDLSLKDYLGKVGANQSQQSLGLQNQKQTQDNINDTFKRYMASRTTGDQESQFKDTYALQKQAAEKGWDLDYAKLNQAQDMFNKSNEFDLGKWLAGLGTTAVGGAAAAATKAAFA